MNDIVLQLRSHNLVVAVDVPRRDDLSWASGPQSKAPITPSALSCRRAHRGEEQKDAATTEGSFSGVHRHSGSRGEIVAADNYAGCCRCHHVGAMTDIGPVAHPLAVQNCESATTAIVSKA